MSIPHEPARGAAAFASRDFRRYQLARLLVIIGAEAQAVAVSWQIYAITHRAIDLGYAGLALFLPGILFLLLSGHAADRYDRRHIILVCYGLQCLCTGTLFYLSWIGTQNVAALFTVLFLVGTGRSFSGPASSALLPHLVPKGDFVNAVSWGASIFQLANFVGPALGDCYSRYRWHNGYRAQPANIGRWRNRVRVCPGNVIRFSVPPRIPFGAARTAGTARDFGGDAFGGIPLYVAQKIAAGGHNAGSVCGAARAEPLRCCQFLLKTFLHSGPKDWEFCAPRLRWGHFASPY